QALLGKWTVTMLLKPVIVMGHLLGGMLTFSLLAWMAWRATHLPMVHADAVVLRRWLVAAIAVLGVQIALGGWVSANYAALSCGAGGRTTPGPHYLAFPTFVRSGWPPADFREAFAPGRGVGGDSEAGVLAGAAGVAIQLAHRMFAVAAAGVLLALAWRLS